MDALLVMRKNVRQMAPDKMMTHMQRPWLTGNTVYEGLPIYFRRPDIRVSEFKSLQPNYPNLLVVQHLLTRVTYNGLPETDYNDSLAEFDAALTEPFQDELSGLVALVETFSGKRTYYVYLTSAFNPGPFLNDIEARFPQESISWEMKSDPKWRLFSGYAADFKFA